MSAYGYIWKFKDDNSRIINKEYCDEAKRKANSVKVRRIYQIDDDKNVVNIFNSIREAARNGYCTNPISKCCKHINEKYKGYIWLYEEEYLAKYA